MKDITSIKTFSSKFNIITEKVLIHTHTLAHPRNLDQSLRPHEFLRIHGIKTNI